MTHETLAATMPALVAVNDNTRPATPVERVLAYLVDMPLSIFIASLASRAATPLIVALGYGEQTVGFFLFANLVEFTAAMLYFAGFECSKLRATPGKRLLCLQVWTTTDTQVGVLRAFWRFFCQVLSSISLFGLFVMFFTKRQQTMHDLYSRTVVVKV